VNSRLGILWFGNYSAVVLEDMVLALRCFEDLKKVLVLKKVSLTTLVGVRLMRVIIHLLTYAMLGTWSGTISIICDMFIHSYSYPLCAIALYRLNQTVIELSISI
jgi:hypothetical protein